MVKLEGRFEMRVPQRMRKDLRSLKLLGSRFKMKLDAIQALIPMPQLSLHFSGLPLTENVDDVKQSFMMPSPLSRQRLKMAKTTKR